MACKPLANGAGCATDQMLVVELLAGRRPRIVLIQAAGFERF